MECKFAFNNNIYIYILNLSDLVPHVREGRGGNKQASKQANKQTTKLDKIDAHRKLLEIR